MRRLTFLLIWLVSLSAGAQQPLGADLKTAQAEFATALTKARTDYEAVVKKTTDAHREKLKAIQTERTKAGDLDGAVAVRDLITELEEGDVTARPKEMLVRDKFATALSKVVWSPGVGGGGWSQKFVLAADGYAYSPPGKRLTSTWAVTGPNTAVVMGQNGIVDVFTIDLAKGTLKVTCVGNTKQGSTTWESTKAK